VIKILVVYASGYGSTAETAKQMGKLLTRESVAVTVSQLPVVENLEQYDAIIVGSPIRYDHWMAAAKAFVKNNSDTLSKMPVAFFFNCLTLAQQTKETEKKADQYAEKIISLNEQIKPLSVGRFGGVLDYTKMPFFLRLIFKAFGSIARLEAGDYRNWNEIHQWTKDIEVKFIEVLK